MHEKEGDDEKAYTVRDLEMDVKGSFLVFGGDGRIRRG